MTRREFAGGLAGVVGAAWAHQHLGALAAQARASINGDRVNRHLAELSAFGKNPYGGVTRLAYSAADRLGREYVTGLMRAAGLEVRVDTAGNILGRRAGSDPTRKPLLFGSHIDSVPDGGNYDGDVGSLSAIEVAQTLGERNVTLRHAIEVVVFQNEEGGTVGSRAMAGQLEPAALTRSRKRRSTSASFWASSASAGGTSRSTVSRTTPARRRWTSGRTRSSRPRASSRWSTASSRARPGGRLERSGVFRRCRGRPT
jgi:hypothetical protein